jgi:hypothetical protein
VAAHRDVLPDAEVAEQPDVLECPGDPGPGEGLGRGSGEIGAVEHDAAAARGDDAGEQVEGRRLAGAVGADQPQDLAAAQLQVVVGEGGEAAEALRQTRNVKHRVLVRLHR